MKWKGFERKRPWHNRDITPEFAWRGREKPFKSSVRTVGVLADI
jgi:hypothetical protein